MNIRDYKNIYMIGIGGISMSGIAEILVNWGFKVSGSDMSESAMTEKLRSNGINVNIGQVKENITKDIDLIVYTAAYISITITWSKFINDSAKEDKCSFTLLYVCASNITHDELNFFFKIESAVAFISVG